MSYEKVESCDLLARTMVCTPENEYAIRGIDEVENCAVMQSPIVEVL